MAIVAVQNRSIWTKQPRPGASIDHGNPIVKRLFSSAKLIASYSGDWRNQSPVGASKIPTIVGTVSNYFGARFSGQKTAGGGRHGRSYSGSSENIYDFTIATVVIFDSVSGIQVITATCSSYYGGAALRVLDGSLGLLHVGLISVNFATVESGVPYSIVLSKSGSSFNFSICDLRSGSINSGVVSDNNAFNDPTSGVFTVGHGRQDDNSVDGSVGQAIISKATLSPVEIRSLAENPWQIYKRSDRRSFLTAGGGVSAELAGTATSTATGTASLTTQIQLTGAAASVATAGGSMTSAISLSGAAASVSVASGVLTTQVRLSGDALAQVLASGALTTQIILSGSAVMQALASADLTTTPAGLSGSASATATATGQLSTGILLLGEASCIAIAAGGLTTAIQMTGAAVSVSTATGDLTVTSGFSASALAEVTATGTLSTQIQLDAAAVMQAIAAASLTTGAQTVAFYDELDAFYGDFAVECSANGTPFNGILDTTDADQFGTLSMSTHRLRYPAFGSAVMAQDEIMVSGVRYKVIEIPRRISRSEMVAELVKQP